MFWDFWKNITDWWVCGPKIPSGMILRRSWSCFTDSPLELSFSVFIEKIFYNFWAICKSSLQFWTNAIRPYLRLSFVSGGKEMRLNIFLNLERTRDRKSVV